MGKERMFIGILVLGLFGCLCDAQGHSNFPSTNTAGFAYTQPPVVAYQTFSKPTFGKPPYTQPPYTQPPYTQAPVVAYPTFGEPPYTQPPVVAHLTFGRPPYTQPPMVAHPTFGEPPYTQPPNTQPPVVAHTTFGKPTYTQPPVVAYPTFGEPPYTQPPVVAHPTFGRLPYTQPPNTQAPVVAYPTFGRPPYTQPPMVAHPTFGEPPYTQPPNTQAPVVAYPTFGKPPYTQPPNTQAPVVAYPTFGRPPYTQPPVLAHPTFGKPSYTQPPNTQAPVVAYPTFGRPPYTQPPNTQAPVVAYPTFGKPPYTQPPNTQAPVVAYPTFGKPPYTQPPVLAHPTFGKPSYTQPPNTQAPVVAYPTFGRPPYTQPPNTQAPVVAYPTFGKPPYTQPPNTQAPVVAYPTFGKPPYTQPPVAAHPTFGKPPYTQPPMTPTFGGPKVPTIPVEAPTSKPNAVKVYCGESSVQMEVDMDLLGIGQLIQPSDITLGGCGPVEQKGSMPVLLFETELHGCGSILLMTEDSLIYSFALNYQPRAIGSTPIIRTSSAVVGIQCHYLRLHNVSSNALKPTWIPYHSILSAEQLLVFSLRIMDDNWRLERASNVFFLGDLINIEAAVVLANHVPLCVFVDTCVATLVPDMNAVPRYAFIENKGCLIDSKMTNSRSRFLPRVQDDKLQFQLDAFRFAQETRSAIYIFCHLKATVVSPDAEGRACSFPPRMQQWIEASGNDQACSCCDSSCSGRKGRSADSVMKYESDAVLGPIVVQKAEDLVQQPHKITQEANLIQHGASRVVFLAGVMVAVGLVCIMVLLWRHYKPVTL
ncbi:proline-rich protein 36-like isoform X6 [Conger conger]|uniref:proline-rich protein 36-like isoform X6 n=1 Tax=Conger conger TaxID=82655 RepID=UPI002A5A14B8|nr:proline-rich protein 36-like isoform X6 [Conger conger]